MCEQRAPINKDHVLLLEGAKLFNAGIEKSGGDHADLTNEEAAQFIRSLRSIEETNGGKLIGGKLVCIVHMQSGKDPIQFLVYEQDASAIFVSV
ncbi:hypothetical protein Enr8_14940 [Blastopirellula retiformator]|uniref:Uncharacterized protein n=2 Tax=Blastopirellula retiformator TaxID=2527970 RepID=A0A5C5V8S8_9BACT|nr:hypothetical protein Enr8_14940 [Blastopirellula retiformator]